MFNSRRSAAAADNALTAAGGLETVIRLRSPRMPFSIFRLSRRNTNICFAVAGFTGCAPKIDAAFLSHAAHTALAFAAQGDVAPNAADAAAAQHASTAATAKPFARPLTTG